MTCTPTVIHLPQELDVRSARQFHGSVRQHVVAGASIVLDATAVERIDGAGAQLIAAIARDTRALGGTFEIEGLPESSVHLLSLAGMGDLVSGAKETSR